MPPRVPMKVEKVKDFKGTGKKLLTYLKPYYGRIGVVLLMSVISTLIAIVGPKISGKITTLLYEGILAKYSGTGSIDFTAITGIVVRLLSLYAVSAAVGYISARMIAKVSTGITYNLRRDISEKIDRLPLNYFDKQTHGDVLSRVTNDVDNIANNLSNSAQQLLSSVITVFGVLFMMLSISWKLTLVALITIPLSGILALTIVKHSQKYYHRLQNYLGQVNGHIEEMYAGHQIVKTYNYEEKSIEDFTALNETLRDSAHKSQFMSAIMMPMTGFIGNINYVAICLLGGFEVIAGRVTLGNIQAFIQYVRQMNQPITNASQLLNVVQSMMAAAERVFELLNQEEEKEVFETPKEMDVEKIKGSVVFEHVKFGYDPNETIIKDFSIEVKPGENVAIVGPTGAGKTTLVKLLMRFYELQGGRILIDGTDITEYSRNDLRELFGMVLQDAWLYTGTIRNNIRYGNPKASVEDVYKACDMAHVSHFIKTLENGYDTVVSEETSGVSQGQKQLLTIARTFLKDPKIIILDEATSSVDTRTEQLIQHDMETLMKDRTSFVIAHRLSTIRNADKIIVLDKGDVVEVGKHDDLLAKNGFYAKLYNSQFES